VRGGLRDGRDARASTSRIPDAIHCRVAANAIADLRSLGIDTGRKRKVSLTVLVSSREKLEGVDAPRFRVAVRIDSQEKSWFQVVVSAAEAGKPEADEPANKLRSMMAKMRGIPAARLAVVHNRDVFESGVPARDGLRERDDLSLGPCELARLPEWLAGAAKKLGCIWLPIEIVGDDLDEANQEKLAAWLDGTPGTATS
jgi:hypothetical protein